MSSMIPIAVVMALKYIIKYSPMDKGQEKELLAKDMHMQRAAVPLFFANLDK